jgi:hypothetical protein
MLVARTFNHTTRDFFDIKNETERAAPVINL